jgi:hypothetical protein
MLGAIWSPFTHSQADQALLRKAAFEQALVGLSKGLVGPRGSRAGGRFFEPMRCRYTDCEPACAYA